MSDRLHAASSRAGAEVHLIVTWPDGTACNDIEEAVKAAARDAIAKARDRTGQRPR